MKRHENNQHSFPLYQSSIQELWSFSSVYLSSVKDEANAGSATVIPRPSASNYSASVPTRPSTIVVDATETTAELRAQLGRRRNAFAVTDGSTSKGHRRSQSQW
jgi:hypothetical protein